MALPSLFFFQPSSNPIVSPSPLNFLFFLSSPLHYCISSSIFSNPHLPSYPPFSLTPLPSPSVLFPHPLPSASLSHLCFDPLAVSPLSSSPVSTLPSLLCLYSSFTLLTSPLLLRRRILLQPPLLCASMAVNIFIFFSLASPLLAPLLHPSFPSTSSSLDPLLLNFSRLTQSTVPK